MMMCNKGKFQICLAVLIAMSMSMIQYAHSQDTYSDYDLERPGRWQDANCNPDTAYEGLISHDEEDIPSNVPPNSLRIYWPTTGSDSKWKIAAKCGHGCKTPLLLHIPLKGKLHFYEIYPDLSIKHDELDSPGLGFYDLLYYADTKGRHTVLVVMNGNASNAAMMQVE